MLTNSSTVGDPNYFTFFRFLNVSESHLSSGNALVRLSKDLLSAKTSTIFVLSGMMLYVIIRMYVVIVRSIALRQSVSILFHCFPVLVVDVEVIFRHLGN